MHSQSDERGEQGDRDSESDKSIQKEDPVTLSDRPVGIGCAAQASNSAARKTPTAVTI